MRVVAEKEGVERVKGDLGGAIGAFHSTNAESVSGCDRDLIAPVWKIFIEMARTMTSLFTLA